MRSTRLCDYFDSRALFIKRLAENFYDEQFLRWLERASEFVKPFPKAHHRATRESVCQVLWLPYDFHPLFEATNVLSKVASRINRLSLTRQIENLLRIGGPLLVKASWRLSGSPFSSQFDVVWLTAKSIVRVSEGGGGLCFLYLMSLEWVTRIGTTKFLGDIQTDLRRYT